MNFVCKYCLNNTQNPFAEMLRYKAMKHGIKLMPELAVLLKTPGMNLPYADEISFNQDKDLDLFIYVDWNLKSSCCFNKYGVSINGKWIDWDDKELIVKTLGEAVLKSH